VESRATALEHGLERCHAADDALDSHNDAWCSGSELQQRAWAF
jgi:hypothetical protein